MELLIALGAGFIAATVGVCFTYGEPYSIRVFEGKDSKGREVFVSQIYLPKIGLGWVYLRNGHYITHHRSWAEVFSNRKEAESAAKRSAMYHRELDERNRISWK